MKYILKPIGEGKVVVLGNNLNSIKKKLKKHWEDVVDFPEEFEDEYVLSVDLILNKKYNTTEELIKDYNKTNEDFSFEESF